MNTFLSRFLSLFFASLVMLISTQLQAGWLLDHWKNHHHVKAHACSLKPVAIPENAVEALKVGESVTVPQYDPDINKSGYVWINWQSKNNIFNLAADFAHPNGYESYVNPYNMNDTTPNIGDWMWDAYINKVDYPTALTKFKIYNKKKTITVPLWEEWDADKAPHLTGWEKFKNDAACTLKLASCQQKRRYKISGYASFDVISGSLAFEKHKPLYSMQLKYNGRQRCFNRPPVAKNQTITTSEDTPIAFNVTATDLDNDKLGYKVATQSAHGTVSKTSTGYLYTPNANYFGKDTIHFEVSDGVASTRFTVNVVVTPVNDAPVAKTQQVETREDTAKTITLFGSDVDSQKLTYSITTQPQHGKLSLQGNQVVYTPVANYFGNDLLVYRVSDGELSSEAKVDIIVKPVNDAPIAESQTLTTPEDTALKLLLKGSDVDSQTLTYKVTQMPTHGTLTGQGNQLTYTPKLNFSGNDKLVFTVSDGEHISQGVVNITVKPVNDAPVASPQQVETAEDTAKEITLLATDVDSDNLTYKIKTQPQHGTVKLVANKATYTPKPNYHGPDSFVFEASDGELSSDATVGITVTPVNDAPVVTDQTVTVVEDTPTTITLTATDVDNDVLTYELTSQPTNGTVTLQGNELVYTPNDNATGTDTITYTVSDGTETITATIQVTITEVNDAPIAESQTVETPEDTPITITLVGKDIDSDNLTYTLKTQLTNGTATISGNEVTYTPAENYTGEDALTFTVSDGELSTDATVSITVTPVNDVPVAQPQSVETLQNQAKDITLTGTDVDSANLTYQITTQPSHGTVSLTNNQVIYTPNNNYVGNDSFVYEVSDGELAAEATVSIVVNPDTTIPVIEVKDVSKTTFKNVALPLDLASDNDLTGDNYQLIAVTQPGNGSVALVDGKLVYTPTADYLGADSFTYKITKGNGQSNVAKVDITVIEPTNQGREFWLTYLRNHSGKSKLYLYTSTSKETTAKVEIPLLGYSQEVILSPGEVSTVDLSEFASQISGNKTISKFGIYISSKDLISVYALNQIQYTTDAASIMPVSSLGNRYIHAGYNNNYDLNELLAIVATEDNTEVNIKNRSPQGSGEQPKVIGEINITLNRGQVYRMNAGTGTSVNSNKSIAFFSGHACTTIQSYACDHLYEQIAPVNQWSQEILTVPLASRKKGDTFRVYAAEDDTKVYINQRYVATLAEGAYYQTILDNGNRIQANKPIWVNQFSNGQGYDGVISDPFMMGLTATNTYLKNYVFTTPKEGFQRHFINIVSPKGNSSSITLDSSPLPEDIVWNDIVGTNYEYAQVPLEVGVHSLRSAENIGLAIYGFGNYDSYGYNGGFNSIQETRLPSQILTVNEDTSLTIDLLKGKEILGAPLKGTLLAEADGTYTYTPEEDFFGLDEVHFKTVIDGVEVIDFIYIDILPVDDAPEPIEVSATTDEDKYVEIGFYKYDKDDDQLTFTFKTGEHVKSIRQVREDADNVYFGYTPEENYFGDDTVVYEISDGNAVSTATANITVVSVNDAPTVTPFTVKTTGDSITFDISQDDEGNPRGNDVEDGSNIAYYFNSANNGTAVQDGNLVTFTPKAGFDGLAQVYYYATDSEGLRGSNKVITINVERVNDTPVAKEINRIISEDGSTTLKLEATDEEKAELTYSILQQPAYGVLEGEGQDYVYKPNPNFHGIDTFVFGASDGNTIGRGKVTIVVNSVNDAPTTESQEITIDEDTPVSITLRGQDVDGDPLTYQINSGGSRGVLTGSLPQFTYTPKADLNGQDTINYRVFDGKTYAYGTIKITVNPVNDAPRPKPVALTVTEDSRGTFYLSATDPERQPVSYRLLTQPQHGTAVLQDGRYYGTYTPEKDFFGTDTFTFAVSDGELESTGTVTVTVNNRADVPVANSTVEEVSENRPSIITLSASDADGDELTYTITQQPVNGTLAENGANPTYTPNTGYVGEDLVKFRVSDGTYSANGEVKLTVKDLPNRLPVWQSVAPTQVEATTLYEYNLSAYDPDTGSITYTLSNAPVGMTLSGTVVRWTPTAEQVGEVTYTVTATDSEGGETPQAVTVSVSEVSVAPEITSQPQTTSYAGKPYRYQVVATDANADDTLTYSVEKAPAGMTMNSETGELVWLATAEGEYKDITVKVSDGYWVRSQIYTLKILKAVPLTATINAPDAVDVSETFDVSITLAGAGSDAVVELTNDGEPVVLNANNTVSLTATELGRHELKVKVTDGNEVSYDTHYYIVRDASDTTEPTITFTQTEDPLYVTKPTDITGEITDDTATVWEVSVYDSYDPDSNSNPAPLQYETGQGNVTGTLTTVDPTLLVNGAYIVVIKVTDAGGNTTLTTKNIVVDGKMKLGELAFTLEDAVVPMPYLDISIQRSYDSRLGYKSGDFGHGWNLGAQQMKMRESRPMHTGWEAYMKKVLLAGGDGLLGTICLRPRQSISIPTITVTLPNGNVETFQPELGCSQGIFQKELQQIVSGNNFTLGFKATGDTQSTFEVLDRASISYGEGRWTEGDRILDETTGTYSYIPFVPKRFRITTYDGTKYEFSRTNFTGQPRIERIIDTTGKELSITDAGITHKLGDDDTGTSVTFTRDTSNRITRITLPDNRYWTYIYDGRGDLVEARAPNSTINKYEYDENHRLLQITDRYGVRLAGYEYDDDGRLVAMIDANGERIAIEHQLDANQQKVTDQNGNVTTYTYDDYGNVTREVDALGNVTVRSFDTKYNKLSETDANGNTTSWTYDDKNNQLTETNALNQTTNYAYDSRGRMLSETDHTGRVVSTNEYDPSGQLTSLKDATGNITAMTYDGSGLTGITDALGNTTSYVYDGDDIKEMTDALGKKHVYTYDANNRKTREEVTYTRWDGGTVRYYNSWAYDAKGRITSETVSGVGSNKTYGEADEILTSRTGGDTTTYVYDANKKVIQTTYPDGSIMKQDRDANGNVVKETDALGRETVHEYDALNRKTKTTYPDGSSMSMGYDGVGNVVSETDARGNTTTHTYDALNRKVSSTDALGKTHTYVYDELGRLVEEKDKLGQVTKYEYNSIDQRTKTTYADGTTMQVEYDALGRKTAEINELGQRTEYSYNALGNLTQVTDALGQVTVYGYDTHGNKISQTDALGRVTNWRYDSYGRQNYRKLPLSNDYASMSYDSKGRVAYTWDFKRQRKRHTYDNQDRLVQTTYADNSTDITDYDAVGNRIKTQVIDAQGNNQTTRYTYDSLNRLSSETKPNGDVLSYGYDVAGNKTRVTLTASNGFTQETTHSYDALNRLASTTDSSGTTSYTYNAVGNKASETKPNGVTTTYSYNSKNQLTQMEHSKDNTVLARYSYTLDLQGKRTQLVEEVFGANPKTTTSTWAYDDLGRLVSETVDGSTTTHEYDAVSNRVKQIKDGVVTNYIYDVNDRLTEETGARTASYTYDKQGNTLTQTVDGVTTNYSYNAKHELVQANDVSFNYDIDGVRSSKTKDDTTISYTTDKNRDYAQVVLEKQNNQTVAAYTYGDDLISQNVAGGTSYFGYDGLGSTKFLTNDSGAITDTYQYDAYGEITSKTGTTDNNYLYTGEQYDRSLNQYYLRARYYNQGVGRFTQMDTWQGKDCTPVTLNKYTYGNASPTYFVDPSGHFGLAGFSIAMNIQSSMRTGQAVGYRVTLRKVGKKITCVAVEQVFEQAVIEAMTSGIYFLKAQNGKGSYVGQSNDFDRRLDEHKRHKKQAQRQIQSMVARFQFMSTDRNERRIVEQFMMNVADAFDEIPDRIEQNNAIRKGSGGSKNTKKLQGIIADLDFCKD